MVESRVIQGLVPSIPQGQVYLVGAGFGCMVQINVQPFSWRCNRHCKTYRREHEYYDLLDRGLIDEITENSLGTRKAMKLTDMGQHYKAIYWLHNREVKEFFQRHDQSRLFAGYLEDPGKWQKLGEFLGVDVRPNYDAHENKTL